MSEKILNVVIKLRRETEKFYDKVKDIFIPLNGEVCLVDSINYGLRAKVGDGKTLWKDLPYSDFMTSEDELHINGGGVPEL